MVGTHANSSKQVNALKHRTDRCKNSVLKEIFNARFKALKQTYRTELIRAKQDSWRKFCTESTKHMPWKLYKICKTGFARTPVPTSLTLLDGSTTSSEEETASALLHKFFPDNDTAQVNNLQGPPSSRPEPQFYTHEVHDVEFVE
jgi:hypothetical protein